MIRVATIAAIALCLLPDTRATAQTVCRASALGSVACPAPPPEPRRLLEADTQALDRVRRRPASDDGSPVFVPARRTNRLGVTQVPAGSAPVARCRSDRLGNLVCQ